MFIEKYRQISTNYNILSDALFALLLAESLLVNWSGALCTLCSHNLSFGIESECNRVSSLASLERFD